MKKGPRYNIHVQVSVSNLSLASLFIVAQPDEDARLQLSNALYLAGEAIREHPQDVLRLATGSPFRIEVFVDEYRMD